MELYADAVAGLAPDEGEIESAEVVVSDDVLVKAFVLGPGAELEAHEHADSTNVFHVLEGTVTVVREEPEATVERSVEAPGVVHHERGDVHGARNETDERAAFTASLCPMPGSG